jgi:twitching motility protein PilT
MSMTLTETMTNASTPGLIPDAPAVTTGEKTPEQLAAEARARSIALFAPPESLDGYIPKPIDVLLDRVVDTGASDLHLYADKAPWSSLFGQTLPMSSKVLDWKTVTGLLRDMVTDAEWDKFARNRRLDFGYQNPKSRFRAHFGVSHGVPYGVFRTINNVVPDLEDLQVPDIISTFSTFTSGLVLFVGVTGSGKSSLQAGLVKKKNKEDAHKIITIEEPIEYRHTDDKCLITQREVGPGRVAHFTDEDHVGPGRDVESFELGVQDAMREAPDMILVGEMRDPATVSAALSAASSGHLVFSTLHAESTADAPTRILDGTPVGRVNEVRAQLSRTLRAVVYQRLLPAVGGQGRVAATEVLIMNQAISNMIRNNELEGIAGQLNSKDTGSIPFEVSLANLVLDGKVMRSVAEKVEIRQGSLAEQLEAGRR